MRGTASRGGQRARRHAAARRSCAPLPSRRSPGASPSHSTVAAPSGVDSARVRASARRPNRGGHARNSTLGPHAAAAGEAAHGDRARRRARFLRRCVAASRDTGAGGRTRGERCTGICVRTSVVRQPPRRTTTMIRRTPSFPTRCSRARARLRAALLCVSDAAAARVCCAGAGGCGVGAAPRPHGGWSCRGVSLPACSSAWFWCVGAVQRTRFRVCAHAHAPHAPRRRVRR